MAGVVIAGAGMAGAQAAIALRQRGYDGPLTLVGDEPHLPYQRPPLSKAYLKDGGEADGVLVRPAAFYAERGVELLSGTRATAIDRDARRLVLDDGRTVDYEQLVLATGTRTRALPALAGALELRTLADAGALRERLAPGVRLLVVGGGFIGLEVAAAAHALGAGVTVVETLERVMARVCSPEVSRFFAAEHERAGVRILLGRRVERLTAQGALLDGGETVAADLVVAGVGVVPNAQLAADAGLAVGDGILVDEQLRTSDPAISAIGDCASFPCAVSGRRLRLESVQNATDHARALAARLTGEPAPYAAVPWFWTEQLGHRLQIAGAAVPDAGEAVLRGDPASGAFSVCRFAGGRLVAVESVGRAADHVAARRLLAPGGPGAAVTPQDVVDDAVPLKALLSS